MTRVWPSPYMASTHNRYLVLEPSLPPSMDFCGGAPKLSDIDGAGKELESKRVLAKELGKFPVAESTLPLIPDWPSLIEFANNFVVGHLEQHDFKAFSMSEPQTDVERDRERILKVATEGIATVGAFLAVIPQVCIVAKEQNPGPELFASAQRSKGFIVSWFSMHASDDLNLAKALASKSQRGRTGEEVFKSLSFDKKWFKGEPDGRIVFNETSVNQLQQSLAARRLPTSGRPLAVYGCPAARWIPPMYDMMAELADANNLFEAIYTAQRSTQLVSINQ